MFFMCELKRLRQLKTALLARYRCERMLATLPELMAYKIENCEEAAALKAAEENLKAAKNIDAANKKKRIRTATTVAAIISLVATVAAALLLSLTLVPAALVIVGGTLVVTLIVHLIAKSVIRKSRAKNYDEIVACEEALAYAKEEFECTKAKIEEQKEKQIAYYENLLNNPCTGILAAIKRSTVVHDDDKDYNTVCQLIWCFEQKYARSVQDAKQWLERAKQSKYVHHRLDQLVLDPIDDYDIELDATDGDDFSEDVPVADAAEG